MMCDVGVGRRMVFGSEERREQMEKQRKKRAKKTEIMRQRREKFWGKNVNKKKKNLKYCYGTIFIVAVMQNNLQ